jgi:hypothetical protein
MRHLRNDDGVRTIPSSANPDIHSNLAFDTLSGIPRERNYEVANYKVTLRCLACRIGSSR